MPVPDPFKLAASNIRAAHHIIKIQQCCNPYGKVLEHRESQNSSNTLYSITDCRESLMCNDQKILLSPKGIFVSIFFLTFLAFPSFHPDKVSNTTEMLLLSQL